jgi:hypothetical protein
MKTALQQAFSDLEELHPNLFNVYTTEGKEFINHFHKYIAMEKEQIVKAYEEGWNCPHGEGFPETGEQYYKETYNHYESNN